MWCFGGSDLVSTFRSYISTGVLGGFPTPSPRSAADGELVAVGDMMADYLQKLPMSVNLHVNKAQCIGILDKKTRYVFYVCVL